MQKGFKTVEKYQIVTSGRNLFLGKPYPITLFIVNQDVAEEVKYTKNTISWLPY